MTEGMKVSVITPSLNQALFIEHTILSVKSQSYPNIEHIVIDGRSTDETIQILKKYHHLIWLSEPDKGQPDAINKGFKLASGDIIAWLNSDDLYEPNIMSSVVHEFKNDTAIDMIYGNCNYIDESDKVLFAYIPPSFNLKRLINSCYNYIPQPTVFYKKSVLQEMGLLDTNYSYAFDYDFFIRMGQKYRIKKVDLTLASYRKHSLTKTEKEILKMRKESLLIGKKYSTGLNVVLHFNYLLGNAYYYNPIIKNLLRKFRWKFLK